MCPITRSKTKTAASTSAAAPEEDEYEEIEEKIEEVNDGGGDKAAASIIGEQVGFVGFFFEISYFILQDALKKAPGPPQSEEAKLTEQIMALWMAKKEKSVNKGQPG